MAFTENLVQSFAQMKALRFQQDLALRQEERYDRQLQENRLHRQAMLGLQQSTQQLVQQRHEETQAGIESRFTRGQEVAQGRLGLAETSPTRFLGQAKLDLYKQYQEAGDTEAAARLLSSGTTINIDPASASERTAIAEGRASLDTLNNIRTLFDLDTTRTGPIVGRIDPTKGLFGATSDEQESFMAATKAFKNAIIKEITGAQMSEPEAKRIMGQVPDITDPRARWLAKWEQSKKNLEFLQRRRLEILGQSGLKVPAGDAMFKSAPSVNYEKTATNPETGEKMGWDGTQWQLIQ
jgi:hypothetical protein